VGTVAPVGCGGGEDPAGAELERRFQLVQPSGTVVVRDCEGERRTLEGTITARFGCTVVDARRGAVTVVTERAGGGTQRARFDSGSFRVDQAGDGLTEVALIDEPARRCSARERRERAIPLPESTRGTRRFRRLLAEGEGMFRTRGQFASATVRGTKWGTQDFCHGTLIVVRRGRMAVRDLRSGRTAEVRAPGTYFARAR